MQPKFKQGGARGPMSGQRKKQSRKELAVSGVLFAVLFAVFAYLFFSCAKYGGKGADETFYLTIPHRLLFGDGLVSDEQHPSLFSSFFLFLPFRVFYTVRGGADGAVLFFRYLYFAVKMIFYPYIYFSLIRRGALRALTAAAAFTAFTPWAIPAVNYYTVPLFAGVVVCMILFVREKAGKARLLLAGFAFACLVITQPAAAVIWFVYCALMIVRAAAAKKNRTLFSGAGELLSVRAWGFITAGVALCAVLFLVYLMRNNTVGGILRSLPELMGEDLRQNSILNFGKLGTLVRSIGVFAIILNALLIVLLAAVRKRSGAFRPVLFFACCACFLITTLSQFFVFNGNFICLRPFPLFLFGLQCYLLCEKKDARLLLFWAFGGVLCVCIDAFSVQSIGFGVAVSGIPAVLLFFDAVRQIFGPEERKIGAERGAGRRSVRLPVKLFSIFGCVLFGAAVVFGVLLDLGSGSFFNINDDYVEATKGPLAGLSVEREMNETQNTAFGDLARVAAQDDGGLFVCGVFPECFLYADVPYATYSAWCGDDNVPERALHYWQTEPEKRPEYIYIPFRNRTGERIDSEQTKAALDFFESVCVCSREEAEGGYLLHVTGWTDE